MAEPALPSRPAPDAPPPKNGRAFGLLLQVLGAFGVVLFMQGVLIARIGGGAGRPGSGWLSDPVVCWVGAALCAVLVGAGTWVRRGRRSRPV